MTLKAVRTMSPLGRFAIGAMRMLMRPWVSVQVHGEQALQARLDRGQPVCWALQFRQLSALVVLDEQTRRLGLPVPLAPLAASDADGEARRIDRHAFINLTRRGQPSPLASRPYAYSPRLQRLVALVRADASIDVQVVPVHVFWGREPRHQESILKALFAEGWAIPGPIRQCLRILIHGRQTLMQFGEPMSLRAMIEGVDSDALGVRRAARLLRAEYRRERERVIGPDLSHRHTLINAVIAGPPVQQAIETQAQTQRARRDKVEAQARRAAWEIASNYSYPFIRAFDLLLQLLWGRIYDGIDSHRFADLRAIDGRATLVYVPCHRSHIDYLLLSYLIYYQGLPPPHVAAGANLNIPVVGSLLRRGGAFFLRRSFRGDALYGAVFAEYLHAMIARGFPIEYFVEGGRSRTGRMLAPKAGMLAMTVESWQRTPQRPLVFVPIYIGYERLIEGDSYTAELSGRPKRKESLIGLITSLRRLREHFGRVHVNVGEPIALEAFLRERLDGQTVLPPEVRGADARQREVIGDLAHEIVTRINDAAVVNPVNLVSMAMLSAPRHAMDASQLLRQIELLRELARRVPYSSRIELSEAPAADIVAQAERTGLLGRLSHPLGDVLQVPAAQLASLAYFRNNVLHVWAMPALLATLLSQQPGIERERLQAIAGRLFPFLRAAFFLSWSPADLQSRIDALLPAFEELGLTGGQPGAPGTGALHTLANLTRQPLQRYFITLSVLNGQGSGALTGETLEDLCHLLAQRMAFLHESGSPEFFDRATFRSIIATLVELGWVRKHDGRLHFDEPLREAAADAPWLLSADVRQAIAQLTHLSPDDLERAQGPLKA